MRILKISTHDIANGPGMRVVVWVSGCEHKCPGCHNPETWDCRLGTEFSSEILDRIIKELDSPYENGITFSGGDPLHPANVDGVTLIAKKVRECLPGKSIWCYTGYSYEEIKGLEIFQYIDVLVDGEFHIDERDITLPYCGSRNQRVIDVKKTLSSSEITLYDGIH